MSKIITNFFILDNSTAKAKTRPLITYANKILNKLPTQYRLVRTINPVIDMNTIEQRINFFHLITSVIERDIDGELIELGSFVGQCAVIFQKILDFNNSSKELHLYDSFEKKFTVTNGIEEELKNNFKKDNLKSPIIHKGLFKNTLPQELPDKIAFAHIDCGWGGELNLHKEIVLFCLNSIYNRLSKGAICVLMDYHDVPLSVGIGGDYNPGVKIACDEFLKDKPEKIVCLYGNQISHAYFKKE